MKILTQPSEQTDQGKLKPVPASLSKFRIPWLDAQFREYDKGYILTQQHICADYRIYYIRISFQYPCTYHILSPEPGIGFISVLEGNLTYPDEKNKLKELPENMCAFIYIPRGIGCICLDDSPCMAVYIQLSERLTNNILTLNSSVKELDTIRKNGGENVSHRACIWSNPRIKELIKTIIDTGNTTCPVNLNVFILIFNTISEYLYIQPKEQDRNTKYFTGKKSILKNIKERIEEDPQRQLTVKELATEYHIKPAQLSSGFKDTYGVYLREFIEMCVMLKAKQLLRTTSYTLKDISFELGYANGPAFTRSYTKYYGYNPSQERSGSTIEMTEK